MAAKGWEARASALLGPCGKSATLVHANPRAGHVRAEAATPQVLKES